MEWYVKGTDCDHLVALKEVSGGERPLLANEQASSSLPSTSIKYISTSDGLYTMHYYSQDTTDINLHGWKE